MKPGDNAVAICGTCPNCNKLIVWFDKDTHKCK